MSQHTFKDAKRRYWMAFVPTMAIYLLATLGGAFFLNTYEIQPKWMQVTVALACAAPMVVFLIVQLRYFFETDEYNRQIQLKGFAYGAAITVGLIFVFGFLQLFHAIETIEIFWFGPFFFIAYGISTYALGGRQCL